MKINMKSEKSNDSLDEDEKEKILSSRKSNSDSGSSRKSNKGKRTLSRGESLKNMRDSANFLNALGAGNLQKPLSGRSSRKKYLFKKHDETVNDRMSQKRRLGYKNSRKTEKTLKSKKSKVINKRTSKENVSSRKHHGGEHPKGRPVQILKFDEDHKLVLDIPALGEILLNDVVRRTPLVILSIAGDFRKGKSFLLNHFLEFFCQGCDADKWLKDLNAPLKGFSWRGGTDRDTSGVLMWSQPFIVKDAKNRNIAVILMDTQGAFDNEFTFKDSALVFALSTMTSSIQVFNLMHNIQDDDLQVLEFFSEYGRLAMEEVDEKPFQKLMFLIRDWQFSYEHPYGFKGGTDFLNKKFEINENMPEELQRARKHINECFEEIGCFLMPYPGSIVASQASFDGRAADYSPEFFKHLREFVPNFLNPKHLVTKKIAGKEITGWEMLEYFKIYAEIFQSDSMPEPKSLFEATATANNLTAMKNSFDQYVRSMSRVCEGRNYINPQKLLNIHEKLQQETLDEFDNTLKIGGSEYSERYREKLFLDMENAFEQFEKQNKGKNFFGVFGTPFMILLQGVVFYSLSTLLQIFGLEQYSRVTSSISFLFLMACITYLILLYNGNYPELMVIMDTGTDAVWTAIDQHVVARLFQSNRRNSSDEVLHERNQERIRTPRSNRSIRSTRLQNRNRHNSR